MDNVDLAELFLQMHQSYCTHFNITNPWMSWILFFSCWKNLRKVKNYKHSGVWSTASKFTKMFKSKLEFVTSHVRMSTNGFLFEMELSSQKSLHSNSSGQPFGKKSPPVGLLGSAIQVKNVSSHFLLTGEFNAHV